MVRTASAVLISSLTIASAAMANNERRITPDDPLFIEFRVDPGVSATPDTLVLSLGTPEALAPGTGERTTVLSNQGVGLGVHQTSLFGGDVGVLDLSPAATFIDDASPYTLLDPGVVDLGSMATLAMGTESGVLEVRITTGVLIVDLDDVTLQWGVGAGPDSFTPADVPLEITDMYVGTPCYADFDRNGELDVFDFLAYLSAFQVEDYRADCDGCGTLNIFDFLCFQQRFAMGCP